MSKVYNKNRGPSGVFIFNFAIVDFEQVNVTWVYWYLVYWEADWEIVGLNILYSYTIFV